MDRRIKHLTDLNESGKLKSLRGGNDTVFVKRQVPWPQNFVLGGNNKSRILYDNLSWCQWVSGFAMIAREENNVDTKNAMLDYLSEIMEDANDFSWQSAKASHAVLLCWMEEGKVEWSETTKIDRIRRAHAQRLPPQNNTTHSKSKSETKTAICRFYQRAMCQHQKDHETGGVFYKHVCASCFTMGRLSCVSENIKKRVGHCQKAVQMVACNFHSVQKSCNTRIVYSKDLKNGCSSNWRADWAKFVGKTYAQVVKVKSDPRGQNQSQLNQVVVKRQVKPTALVKKCTVVPASSSVTKNDKNTKHVKCKKVKNFTGMKTLPKVSQACDNFQCQSKNKFEPLAPFVEGSKTSVDTVTGLRPESSLKSMKHTQTQHTVTKVPSTSVSGRALQDCQKTRQNHSEHIAKSCQKHLKVCSENNTPDDKYDLALQTKSENKIK